MADEKILKPKEVCITVCILTSKGHKWILFKQKGHCVAFKKYILPDGS